VVRHANGESLLVARLSNAGANSQSNRFALRTLELRPPWPQPENGYFGYADVARALIANGWRGWTPTRRAPGGSPCASFTDRSSPPRSRGRSAMPERFRTVSGHASGNALGQTFRGASAPPPREGRKPSRGCGAGT
jgi:hypothetical protein